MILSDSAILEAMDAGDIHIDPFDRKALGGNSYDVHLSKHWYMYDKPEGGLDCRIEPTGRHFEAESLLLTPGRLYLASTIEYTSTFKYVPYLDGKSSIGRLGIFIHATAGRGDVGFRNHWTMEISVVEPITVYEGMPIGQLTYHMVKGSVDNSYDTKRTAKYNQRDPRPQPSRMWKNFA